VSSAGVPGRFTTSTIYPMVDIGRVPWPALRLTRPPAPRLQHQHGG
jgi:hypothetical protein